MNHLFDSFALAYDAKNGYSLAQTLTPVAPPDDPGLLVRIWNSTNAQNAKSDILHYVKKQAAYFKDLGHDEINGWVEVYFAYWKALGVIVAGENGKSSWTDTYEAWKALCSVLIRGYNNCGFQAWTIPTLYLVGKYLRIFAIKSDEERARTGAVPAALVSYFQDDFDPEMQEQAQLRDCEQHLKRIFTLCLNDRAPLEESRKWGIYYIINLLFKTYFKLNSASLSMTILKTLAVYNNKGDMPPLEKFPMGQRVTFRFYEGVLHFLEENYVQAEKSLFEAWQLCHKDAKANLERILTYLVPCRMMTSHVLPSKELLEPYPLLQQIFLPLSQSIRRGDLGGFNKALQEAESELIRRRIYLTLERGHDIAFRNLLRKVYLAGGYDEPKEGDTAPVRRTRIPIGEFVAAVRMSTGDETMVRERVELLMCNIIYKDLMKGYISRERGIVVLSKKGAFPGTGV
ncbi:COP9 signalosome complex subunit 12 [Ophiocordyceps camponoti-floridani]|uniref:COP9 signalosome complex subunit 12 n=1 Tax=Ophiocordyceps camponoti-floridani TaxID=2030778 RepID=A0A8H4VE28_9HYPO|nr:COP9 signalosome complex subunit 12 [Ophiocordyceps camponoti-floridani]